MKKLDYTERAPRTLIQRLDDAGIPAEEYEDAVQIDGYDSACIGYSDDGHLIYDYELLVADTMDMSGGDTDWESAEEYVQYNILGAYLSTGERHPIIIHTI